MLRTLPFPAGRQCLAYAMARINIRYKMLSKIRPRKWGDEGHGLGEPAPALEPPRNSADARNVLDQHPLKEQIMAWQRIADAAKKKTKVALAALKSGTPPSKSEGGRENYYPPGRLDGGISHLSEIERVPARCECDN